jgi:UMF1 family MFS transporter
MAGKKEVKRSSRITKKEWSWVLYDLGSSAYSITITAAILPIFFKSLTDAAGIEANRSTAYWGYSVSIATLLVAVLAPILGTISDYKLYKKRFFLFFALIGIIFTGALATVGQGQWLRCLLIYVFAVIGFAGSNVFYNAFLVDVTDEKRMDWISSSGFAFGYIGSVIPFTISILLIQYPSLIGLDTMGATRIAFIITAVWWTAFTIPILVNVRQEYFIEPEPQPVKKSFIRLVKTFKNVVQYREIFLFLIAYFFYIDGVDTVINMATVYGTDLGISAVNLLIILLATQVVAFPFTLVYGRLARRFSARVLILVAIVIYIFIVLFAFFVTTTLQFWILAMLVATSQGGIQALSRSYFGKIIPKENSGEFFGFYNIFGRFAAILGPFLVGIVSQFSGSSRYGVLSIGVLFIIGFILLFRLGKSEDAREAIK